MHWLLILGLASMPLGILAAGWLPSMRATLLHLELVSGFAHLSHATVPQMPTVTTLLTGALAVALVAQDDDVASESKLHVPVGHADAWLPVEPGFA